LINEVLPFLSLKAILLLKLRIKSQFCAFFRFNAYKKQSNDPGTALYWLFLGESAEVHYGQN